MAATGARPIDKSRRRCDELCLSSRLNHPGDRRAFQVILTKKGKSLEDELCEVANRVLVKVTAPLTNEEQSTLVRLLEKIRR